MKKNLMSKMSLLLVVMLVAAMTFGCGKKTETTTDTQSTESQVEEDSTAAETDSKDSTAASESDADASDATAEDAEYEKVGEGDTTFYFIVTDADGNSTYYEVSTDETTVGAALLELGMIAGDDSEYGLYVKTVNGITADYDTDGSYWAFYIDGQYADTGVDATDITAGSTYTFVVEK